MNTEGELSLDVVIGLSIFMIAFIFVAQYIPSIFVVENEELSLYPLAYRTSAILAEDSGFWNNGSVNGTDWENHLNVDLRIGLSGGEANVLSVEKIAAFNDYYNNYGYESVRRALGLETPTRQYDYNISLQLFASNSSQVNYARNQSGPLLLVGNPVPDIGKVARYERIVAYDNLTAIASISSNIGTPSTTVNTFNVTSPVGAFLIVVEDRNTNQTASEPWMNVKVNGNLVINVSGNATIATFDITDYVNGYSGTVYVWIQSHNIRGYVVVTDGGEYVGGRLGAKLVVILW